MRRRRGSIGHSLPQCSASARERRRTSRQNLAISRRKLHEPTGEGNYHHRSRFSVTPVLRPGYRLLLVLVRQNGGAHRSKGMESVRSLERG